MVAAVRPLTARQRGQLLLAGAFVLAVGVIGFAFVLNASTYTGTLANEESAISRGSDAVAAREAVRSDLAHYLGRVNHKYDEAGVANPTANYETAVRNTLPKIGVGIRDHYASRGALVNVTDPSGFTRGVKIRSYRDASGDPGRFWSPETPHSPNWQVAGSTRVRNATFVFTDDLGGSNPFEARFQNTGSGDEWVIEVVTVGDEWELTVKRGSSPSFSTTVGSCRRTYLDASGDRVPMSVDLARGTAAGSYCHALAQLDPSGEYALRFVNGDRMKGTYDLVARDPGIVPSFIGMGNTEQEVVLYDVTVDFEYHSASVDYETELTVAPEEI